MYNNYCEIDCWNEVGLVALKFNSFRLKKKKKKDRISFKCKMNVCTMPYLSPSPFVPLYPTYRSCFKEFRPPIFLRNRYP